MATRNVNILMGCNEPLVVKTIRVILANADKGGPTLNASETGHCDEFIEQACNGEFGLAVIYPNCLFPAKPYTLLEHSLYAIKSIKAIRPVPIIALTSMDEWLEPLRSAGANVCLKMPFDLTDFLRAVDGCLQRPA